MSKNDDLNYKPVWRVKMEPIDNQANPVMSDLNYNIKIELNTYIAIL